MKFLLKGLVDLSAEKVVGWRQRRSDWDQYLVRDLQELEVRSHAARNLNEDALLPDRLQDEFAESRTSGLDQVLDKLGGLARPHDLESAEAAEHCPEFVPQTAETGQGPDGVCRKTQFP